MPARPIHTIPYSAAALPRGEFLRPIAPAPPPRSFVAPKEPETFRRRDRSGKLRALKRPFDKHKDLAFANFARPLDDHLRLMEQTVELEATRNLCHICAGTGLAPCHIFAGTGLAPCHICAGTGPAAMISMLQNYEHVRRAGGLVRGGGRRAGPAELARRVPTYLPTYLPGAVPVLRSARTVAA